MGAGVPHVRMGGVLASLQLPPVPVDSPVVCSLGCPEYSFGGYRDRGPGFGHASRGQAVVEEGCTAHSGLAWVVADLEVVLLMDRVWVADCSRCMFVRVVVRMGDGSEGPLSVAPS